MKKYIDVGLTGDAHSIPPEASKLLGAKIVQGPAVTFIHLPPVEPVHVARLVIDVVAAVFDIGDEHRGDGARILSIPITGRTIGIVPPEDRLHESGLIRPIGNHGPLGRNGEYDLFLRVELQPPLVYSVGDFLCGTELREIYVGDEARDVDSAVRVDLDAKVTS